MTLKFNPHPPVAPAHRPIVNLQADRDRLAAMVFRLQSIPGWVVVDGETMYDAVDRLLTEMGYLEETK